MSRDAPLPPRCVKCNEPAELPTKARRVYWFSSWLYLLVPVNVILFAFVVLLVRKKAVVSPGLCLLHKKKLRNWIGLAKVGVLLGIIVIYVGSASPLGFWGALIGMLMMVASIVVGMRFGRPVRAQRIDPTHVRLRGCSEPFLQSLSSQ